MRHTLAFFALLSFVSIATVAYADSPQYWIGITDSTGYTLQNVWFDHRTIDQEPSVGRMALNTIILRDGILLRENVTTLLLALSAEAADSVLSRAVVSSNLSLMEIHLRRILSWAIKDSTNGLPSTATLKKTTADSTEDIATYSR